MASFPPPRNPHKTPPQEVPPSQPYTVGPQFPPPYQEVQPGYASAYNQPYIGSQYPPGNFIIAPPSQPMMPVEDNMLLSMVTLFFCCIFGIAALYKSNEARGYNNRGDYRRAYASAKTAKSIAIVGILCGLFVTFVMGIAPFILALTIGKNSIEKSESTNSNRTAHFVSEHAGN